jgi:hypothetical protein
MTFFSDEEFGEEHAEAANAALDELTAPPAPQVDEDAEDAEIEDLGEDVERRLEVASLFKTLLQGRLFDESTNAAKFVEKRVKAFVKSELKALIGMGQPMRPTVEADFSAEEVGALKAVAAKVLNKGAVPAAPAAPVAPQLRSRPIPSTPTVAPRPATPTSKAPPPKPAAKPAPAKPAAKPTQAPPSSKKTAVVSEYVTEEGERVRDLRRAGRLIKQYFNKEGKLIKEKDVTPQARPRNGIPPPTPQALQAISHQQAVASVSARMETMAASADTSVLALPVTLNEG